MSEGPRFSVLLPTRNGGPRLDTCIRSVLDQPRDDIELVVADNANQDETAEVLAAYAGDPRLRVIRSDEVLSVTDNWVRALECSSGDYVMLLGDDDLLLPRYFERIDEQLRAHGDPDCLTCNGYIYIFPEPGPDGPGHYRDPAFAEPEFEGGIVPIERRRAMVREMFRGLGFDAGFAGFQRTVTSRRARDLLPNGRFKGPYPDLYAMAALLVTAPRWIYTPEKLVVLGISVGSFTNLTISDRQDQAMDRLALDDARAPLPGDPVLNTLVVHLEKVRRDFPGELAEMRVNQRLYTLRQVWRWVRQTWAGGISRAELRARAGSLSAADWLKLPLALGQPETLRAASSALRVHLGFDTWLSLEKFVPLEGVRDMGEFASWLQDRDAAERPAPAPSR